MEKLKRDPSSLAAITEDGRIGWVNQGWLEFARDNSGAGASIHVGDNYFAGISGEIRGLFEAAVQCGNCRRTRTFSDEAWHWVPAWVERPPAGVAYVMCSICGSFSWRKTAREVQGRTLRLVVSRR